MTTADGKEVLKMQAASFVQSVPDHCDRIIWRGHYYHLPLKDPPPALDPGLSEHGKRNLAQMQAECRAAAPSAQAFDAVAALAEIHRMLKPGRPLHSPEMNYQCIIDHLTPEVDSPFDVEPAQAFDPGPMDFGFNQKECEIIGEMLAEKDMDFKHTVKAALRLYQLVHKGTMAGAEFLLVKDGKSWPDAGPMLFDECQNCGGTGKFFVGFSGQESDGNAPLYEPCDDCATPSPPPPDAAAKDLYALGISVMKDGERVDPRELYAPPGIAQVRERFEAWAMTLDAGYYASAWEGWCAALGVKP